MRRRFRRVRQPFAFGGLLLSIYLCASTTGEAQPPPTATDGVARREGEALVVSVTVRNPTMYDLYVVSAASDAATAAKLREWTAGSQKDVKEILVPAFGTLEMSDRGAHIVLTGVRQPLKDGDTIEIVLTTDGGLALATSAKIAP